MKVYSFKDLSGAFNHPLAGEFLFAGKIGIGSITVLNSTERSAQLVGADGGVVQSYVAGDNGQVNVETQQTSDLHKFFLRWFNLSKTAADNGDPTEWLSASINLRDLVDGTGHICTGVSPTKVPDFPRGPQAQNVTWVLMCADIQHQTA